MRGYLITFFQLYKDIKILTKIDFQNPSLGVPSKIVGNGIIIVSLKTIEKSGNLHLLEAGLLTGLSSSYC